MLLSTKRDTLTHGFVANNPLLYKGKWENTRQIYERRALHKQNSMSYCLC